MATQNVTVADGGTTSGAVSVDEDYIVVGFRIPAGAEGTSMSFTARGLVTDAGYVAVEDDSSTAVTITYEADKITTLSTGTKAEAIRYLKDFKCVVSAQTGALVIGVMLQKVN